MLVRSNGQLDRLLFIMINLCSLTHSQQVHDQINTLESFKDRIIDATESSPGVNEQCCTQHTKNGEAWDEDIHDSLVLSDCLRLPSS